MKMHRFSMMAAAAVLLSGTVALCQDQPQRDDQGRETTRRDERQKDDRGRSQHDRFDDHDQQAARNWYDQHQDHQTRGLRTEDRLSADEEARLREGESLDRNLRRKAYAAPTDLSRNLPRAPRGYRYVVIGGHVVMMDNQHRVRSVIHLHDNG